MINMTQNILLMLDKTYFPATVFLIVFLVGILTRTILFSYLKKIIKKTHIDLDDILISSLRRPVFAILLTISLYLSICFANIEPQSFLILQNVLFSLGIISVAMACSGIVNSFIKYYAKAADSISATSTISKNVSNILIYGISILVILRYFGISITPILATLGVGGIAVALALQDTLSNLFSGLQLMLTKTIKINDYIKLSTGEEGYVKDINWRTTRILTDSEIIIPNIKIAQTILTNYSLPDRSVSLNIKVKLDAGNDLQKVEDITIRVAKEISKIDPVVRFNDFVGRHIELTTTLKVSEYGLQANIKHDFIKRLHEAYKKEGILFPLNR